MRCAVAMKALVQWRLATAAGTEQTSFEDGRHTIIRLIHFYHMLRQYDTAWDLPFRVDRPTEEERPYIVSQYAPIWTFQKDEESGKWIWGTRVGSLADEPVLQQALMECYSE